MNEPSKALPLIAPSKSLAVKFIITGAVFPSLCLMHSWFGASASPNALWQSGNTDIYCSVLLAFPSIGPFIPLILYAMICLSSWSLRPSLIRHLWIRVGIYLGALLSVQIFILVISSSGPITAMAAILFGPTLTATVFGGKKLLQHYQRFSIKHILILTAIIAIAMALLRQVKFGLELLAFLYSLAIVSAPTLCLITYGRASFRILQYPPGHRSILMNVIAYVSSIGLYGISWRTSLSFMLEEYAKLPTTNPNCYVSSAAANGHPLIVRAEAVRCSQGSIVLINQQMRRVKFLELALKCFSPYLHGRVRRIYDRIGPKLAEVFRSHPLLADIAFVMLMPFEGLAELIRFSLGIPNKAVARLYPQSKV